MNTQKIDVLAVTRDGYGFLTVDIGGRQVTHGVPAEISDAIIARQVAVAELIATSQRISDSMLPTLVRQSSKNENAGFIDWRDWVALYGEVNAMRQALARIGGAK